MNELDKKTVYCEAYDHAIPLDELLTPDELESDPDSLDLQVAQSASEYISGGNLGGSLQTLIEDYSRIIWRDSLPRIGMQHLVYENKKAAVENGIWPNSMNKWDALEALEDLDVPDDCWEESRQVVYSGLYDGTHPAESNRYE